MTGSAIRGVIFDLDGLLVDSEPVQIEAWETFLARYHRSLSPGLLQRMFGLRIWDSARLLIDELALPLTVDEVVRERDALFFDLLPGRLLAMPGAVTTVHALAARSYRLALATSGHRLYVDIVLSELQLEGVFEAEVTGDMVTHGKPSPDIYLAAANQLALSPKVCVALEDAPIGIASSKAAGMTCLAIPNEMTRDLSGIELADAVLTGLDEVVPWLENRV
ncbi:MAG TPA: HAD family phosphatase [Nitrolancea sp.]|jgi:HAD superfamily hydrolase (TIGR01509 family)|nr:HAD family phosphatase [Nitrolancea sp.]